MRKMIKLKEDRQRMGTPHIDRSTRLLRYMSGNPTGSSALSSPAAKCESNVRMIGSKSIGGTIHLSAYIHENYSTYAHDRNIQTHLKFVLNYNVISSARLSHIVLCQTH